MDGHIIIGTELDTKDLESQLKDAEKLLNKYQKEYEKLNNQKIKSEIDISQYKSTLTLLEQMRDEELKMTSSEQQRNEIMKGYAASINVVKQALDIEEQTLQSTNEKISNNVSRQHDLNNEIQEMENKLNKAKGFDNIKNSIDKIGDSVSDVIKKTARWGLAIFGIRSAYNFVRQSISTLSQYNEQMATNVEYIRYLLASTLQPVIERLIQLAYQLLTYINYIAKAWFNVDLFANASVNAFSKAKKGAKDLQKTVAGFDKLNILQDNKSDSSGANLPSFPTPEDVPIPSWVQWIADNGELITAILGGIAAGLISIHFGASLIMGLGIGVAVAGLILLIQGIIDYLNDPTWDNFGKVLIGLGLLIAGIAIAFGAWPVAVAGAVVAVVGLIVKYWKEIKAFFQKGIDWLTGKSNWVHEMFGDTIGAIYDTFVRNLQLILNWFDFTFNNIKGIFNDIISFVKNVFTGNWKGAFENLVSIVTRIFAQLQYTVQTIFKGIVNFALAALESAINWPINKINTLTSALNNIPGVNIGRIPTVKLPRLAKGGILNMPGRGVDYYGANIGERGREGVVPLDNEASLRIIGESIAKHTKFNADITLELESRVLARVMKEINSDRNFARNGG